MPAQSFSRALTYTLLNEGGYVNDPQDPGGPTNRGITLATLAAWRKRSCTAEDVRQLGMAETQDIYRALYWNPIAGDKLPEEVGAMVLFDIAVNCGAPQAARTAQAVAGVTADGVIGPVSLRAIGALKLDDFVAQVVAAQHAFYLQVVRQRPASRKFHPTWQKRVGLYFDLLA